MALFNAGAAVYGAVRFETGAGRRVRDAVVAFESAQAADLFAVEQGWHDYAVCPLYFFVDRLPTSAAVGVDGQEA